MGWITPMGLPVMQPYRHEKKMTIKSQLTSLTLADYNDSLPVNCRKQSTAVPPNYVHSLDATHMLMTAIRMKEMELDFAAVHDSFWTHPCNVEIMGQHIRECFSELYSKDIYT